MEHFLCEVFDIPNLEYIKIKELFDVANSTLLYDKIYEHHRIQSSLIYGYAWLSIFGVYPSKIEVFSLVEKNHQVIEANLIIQNVLKETLFQNLVQNINTDQIATNVTNFIQNIKIKTNVKKHLILKMAWRLDPIQSKNMKFKSKSIELSLLSAFFEMCNIDKLEQVKPLFTAWKKHIIEHELLIKNVLTNNYLYTSKNYIDIFTTLTPFECMTRTIYSDLYMLRMLLQSSCIHISPDADHQIYVPVLNSIAKTTRSLFIVERKNSCDYSFYNHPKCVPLDSIANKLGISWQNIWLMIPKISQKTILVTRCAEKTHEEFELLLPTFRGICNNNVIICETHAFPDGYRSETLVIQASNNNNNKIKGLFIVPVGLINDCLELEITDYLMKYLMALTNPYSHVGVQNSQNNTLVVFDMITRYYLSLVASKSIDNIRATKIVEKSDYVIVLIDNRDNPMSIMSSYITLSNLKDQVWSLLVITSDDSVDYYNWHCPLNTHVITHPFLNKKPFDIEIYNALLKDEDLWKTISFYGKYCLMIQDDGIIVKKGIEDLIIYRQIKYDYIGSAWRICAENNELADMCHKMIGNGGLSFRNCAIMLKVCRECVRDKYLLMNNNMQPIAEDVFFSKCVEKIGGKIAPMDIALKFAFEQVMFREAYGFHKFWVYHNIHDVDAYICGILATL